MNGPGKNSAAGTRRAPAGPSTSTSPSVASSSAGSSAAGSAWASDPHSVPRARISGWAMSDSVRTSSGWVARTSGSRSSTPSVTAAPTVSTPSSTPWVFSSGQRVMSMSTSGVASRSAIIGTRLWPPARMRASRPFPRPASASAVLPART